MYEAQPLRFSTLVHQSTHSTCISLRDGASSIEAQNLPPSQLPISICCGSLKAIPVSPAELEPKSPALDLWRTAGYSLAASLQIDPSGQPCCRCLQEFQEGPWSQQNLEPSACMLIPVTGPRGGAVVVGESTICYFHDSQPMRACQIDATLIRVRLRFSSCC